MKNNLISIKLGYSPKDSTLKRKFGNLPVKYCRLNVDNEQELVLFEKALRQYTFNCVEEDDQVLQHPDKKKVKLSSIPALPSTSSGKQDEVLEVLELLDDEVESQAFL